MFFFEEKTYNLKGKTRIPEELVNFWQSGGLDLKLPLDTVFTYKDNGKIIAAGGFDGNVIKGLLVDEDYQGYNLTGKIISRILEELANKGVFHVFLFKVKFFILF